MTPTVEGAGVLPKSSEAWLARPSEELPTSAMDLDVRRVGAPGAGVRISASPASDPGRALALPLFGSLAGVKDNIDVAGLPTTAACPACVRARAIGARGRGVEAAGAIVIGKTNLDQFATGLVERARRMGGAERRSIRGSSRAARARVGRRGRAGPRSLLARHRHGGLGTRARAFNNIVGLKPIAGLLSTRGVVPAADRSTASRSSR